MQVSIKLLTIFLNYEGYAQGCRKCVHRCTLTSDQWQKVQNNYCLHIFHILISAGEPKPVVESVSQQEEQKTQRNSLQTVNCPSCNGYCDSPHTFRELLSQIIMLGRSTRIIYRRAVYTATDSCSKSITPPTDNNVPSVKTTITLSQLFK